MSESIQTCTRIECFLLQISKKMIPMKNKIWFSHCFVPYTKPQNISQRLPISSQQNLSAWWRDATAVQPSIASRKATFESSGSSKHQAAPSKWCEYCFLFYIQICILVLKHHVAFLFIGHFSPSISTGRRAREKSCACMCTHTPLLSLTFTHTRARTHARAHWEKVVFTTSWRTRRQEVLHLIELERETRIESDSFLDSSAIMYVVSIRFAFHLLVTPR